MANKFAVVNGNFNATSTWSDTPAGAAGASVPVAGDNAYANGKTVTITANATCDKISIQAENGATNGGTFTLSGGVTLNANVVGGSGTSNCLTSSFNSPGVSTINGNITGGAGVYNAYGFSMTGSGTININGNIFAGAAGAGVIVNGGGIMNIVGAISAASLTIAATASCAVSITGTVSAGTGATAISFAAPLGSLNITGSVYGSSVSTNGWGISVGGVAPITITGNVYGGNGGSTAHGIYATANGAIITVNGNVYGCDTVTGGQGISLNISNGTVTVNGSAYAGRYGHAISVANPVLIKVIRAVGSTYGAAQTTGALTSFGINAGAYTCTCYVEEIQYGANGMTPTYGPIFLTPKSTNVALLTKSDLTQKTLYDATNVTGALPAASDIRYGVVYNYSANSGTCRVPAASSVAYGVLVDNTTGTAILTASAIWDSLTSTMTTSGSIGERLKNVSTIASTSQQLADALSA